MAVSTSKSTESHIEINPAKSQLSSQRKGKGKERRPKEVDQGVDEEVAEDGEEWGNTKASSWSWISLTESSISKVTPLFTKDGSYFFSIVGSCVKIHSVASGQVISTLSSSLKSASTGEAKSDILTSAVLNPHNAYQLITASLNGCIMVWDFLDAVLLQTIDISQPIHYICAHEKFKDTVFVSASPPKKSDDNAVVLRVSLKPTPATADSLVQKSLELIPFGKTKKMAGLAISPSGTWLVAVGGHKSYVARTAAPKSGFTKYVSPETLTCLAFHPSDEYFATGDVKGNIRLWYCLDEQVSLVAAGVEKKAQTTMFHWHAHAVSSLAFSPNGAYLLSSGEEAVLVIWQLHTGKKEFVPRVGAPIETIAVSRMGDQEEEYLLGLADATYTFVNAGSLKISRSYSRIKLDPSSSNPLASGSSSAPLAVHGLTSTLILPSSHPSSLQTYSPSQSRLVAELEISPSNRVSRRDEKPLVPTRVQFSVVTTTGHWMATIDWRDGDDTFRAEAYLKLWWWDRKNGYWILNTRIDRPHGQSQITSISFGPGLGTPILVTTGTDGLVKTWSIRRTKEKNGSFEESWVARSSLSFRNETPTHASWSFDGSLLAVSLNTCVALYEPLTNVLVHNLTLPTCKHISKASFVSQSSRFLAIAGGVDLVLWDLINQTVVWHHKSALPIRTIVPHPFGDTFAITSHLTSSNTHKTVVSIFNSTSNMPTASHPLPFRLLAVEWYSTSPQSIPLPSDFSLVAVTHTWHVVLMGHNIALPEDTGMSSSGLPQQPQHPKRSLFDDMFGVSSFAPVPNVPPPSTPHIKPWTGQEAVAIFQDPAYRMPPIHSLYDDLMSSFIRVRSDTTPDPSVEQTRRHVEEDVEMTEIQQEPLRKHSARVVGDEEMSMFVELFKQQTVTDPVKPPLPVPNVTHKVNGVKKPPTGTKGLPRVTAPPASRAPSLVAPPTPSSLSPANGDTPITSRKRKKSLS